MQAAVCINTFGMPVALKKIGWHVYLLVRSHSLSQIDILALILVTVLYLGYLRSCGNLVDSSGDQRCVNIDAV